MFSQIYEPYNKGSLAYYINQRAVMKQACTVRKVKKQLANNKHGFQSRELAG